MAAPPWTAHSTTSTNISHRDPPPPLDQNILRLGQEQQDQYRSADRIPAGRNNPDNHRRTATGLAQGTAHRQRRSLPYRVAGVLVLLYAQPLTKIAALQGTVISQADGQTLIALGKQPHPGARTVRLTAQLPPSPSTQSAHHRRSRRHPLDVPQQQTGLAPGPTNDHAPASMGGHPTRWAHATPR